MDVLSNIGITKECPLLHNQKNYAVIKGKFHSIFIRTDLLVILFYLISTAVNTHYFWLSLPIISFLN